MLYAPIRKQPARRSTNVSLDAELVADAKSFGVNISRACEAGLADEVRKLRIARWQEENREAIASWNAWTAKHGLPLDKYRMF